MIKNELRETDLKTSDFFYNLPSELIAQTPIEPRDHSRLLVVSKDGVLTDKHFYDVIDYLNPGDTLVINDSRVIPARIYGTKVRESEDFVSPASKIETLLLKQHKGNEWEVLLRPAKKIKIGGKIQYDATLVGTVLEILEDGNRLVKFEYDEEKYKKALRIRDCGIDRAIFRDDIGEISPACDISEIGYSAVMSNVNAYIGFEQMKVAESLLKKQRENAKKWAERLKNDSSAELIRTGESMPNYWVLGILADNKREAILRFREEGFYASGVHINNNVYSVFGDMRELAGVNEFYSRFVALPCGWWIGENEI